MADGCVLSVQTCPTLLNPNPYDPSEVSRFDFLTFPPSFYTNSYMPSRANGFQCSPRSAYPSRQPSGLGYMDGFPSSHGVPSYSHDTTNNTSAATTSSSNSSNDMPLDWKTQDQPQMYPAQNYYSSYSDNQQETKSIPSSGRADYVDQLQPASGPTAGRTKSLSPLIVSTSWADPPGSIGPTSLARRTPMANTFLVDQGEALDGISIWGEEFTENKDDSSAAGPSRPAHPFHAFTSSSVPLPSLPSSMMNYRSSVGRPPSYSTGSYVNSGSAPTSIPSSTSSSSSSVSSQLSSSAQEQQATNAPFVATGPFEETTFSRYQQMFNEKHAPERRFATVPSSNVLSSTRMQKDYVTVSPSMDMTVAPSAFPSSSSVAAAQAGRRASFHLHTQQQQQQQHQHRRPSISDGKNLVQQAGSALLSTHYNPALSETSGSDVSLFPYDNQPPPLASSSNLSSSPSTSSLPSSLGLTPKTSSTLSTVQEGCLSTEDGPSSWTKGSPEGPSSDPNNNGNSNTLKAIRSAQTGYWMNNPTQNYSSLSSGSPAQQQASLGITHSSSSSSSSLSSIPAQAYLGASSASSASSYTANAAPFRPMDDFPSFSAGPQMTQDQYRMLLLGQQRMQAHQKCFTPEAPESSSSSASASSFTATGSPYTSGPSRSLESCGPLSMSTATIEPRSFQVGSYPSATNAGLTNLSMMNASLPTDISAKISRPDLYEQVRENTLQTFNWAAAGGSGGNSAMYPEKNSGWPMTETIKGGSHGIRPGSQKTPSGKRKETNHSNRGGSASIDRKYSKKKTVSAQSSTFLTESRRDMKGTEVGEHSDGRSDRSPAQGIKKVSLACHFCRGRKLRCDATRPTCSHCVKRDLCCTYDSVIRRRGPGKRKNGEKPPAEGPDHEGGETDD